MVWTSLKRNSISSISLSASRSFLLSTGDIVLLAAILSRPSELPASSSLLGSAQVHHRRVFMVPHLLLIEGDTQMREAVERGLGSRGFIVSCAQDGAAGIGLLGKLKIDLVLLDLILPDMDGLRVLEDIRALEPRMPVIMLTALDDSQSTVGSLDAGADDYVTKPVSLDELAARVRARLRWRGEGGGGLKGSPPAARLANP